MTKSPAQLTESDLEKLSHKELQELAGNLEKLTAAKQEDQLSDYKPYPKQLEFHTAGKDKRERLFMAANQVGKSIAGSRELAFHLTGKYPDWWKGRKFTKPIRAWAAGVTTESTRDNCQRLLLGQGRNFGTGAIPKKLIDGEPRMARSLSDTVDTVYVKHISGKNSSLTFKSYERGREKFQGETLDVIWLDEEPEADIYSECLTRTAASKGFVFLTATPLLGMSDVIRRYIQEESEDRFYINMTIDEAEHISPEEREKIVAGYRPHEREARALGKPMLGSGKVYPIIEEEIKEKAIDIPQHWPRIVGLDFGWEHPTAAVWIAWDRDTDTVHVYDVYKASQETPVVHAAAIRARGKIPVAWPKDGLAHDKGSGDQLAKLYKKEGVKMLQEHAQFPDGSVSVEAGIFDILDRMKTGRFKVAEHLYDFWQEIGLYHRKEGKIIKKNDDVMDAMRYGVMMLRKAKTRAEIDNWNRSLPARDLSYVV